MKITPLKIALVAFALVLAAPLAGVGISVRGDGQTTFSWLYLCILMSLGAYILHDIITPGHDFHEKDGPPRDQMM